MEPPFPIPNREVKRISADNSIDASCCEDRSWPESRNQNRFNRFYYLFIIIISLISDKGLETMNCPNK